MHAQKLIELTDVSKKFGSRPGAIETLAAKLGVPGKKHKVVHALDGVTMEIAKGEVVGLVGESGCGKSTLGRLVAGIHKPSAGQVFFAGRDRASLRGQDAIDAKLKVQMVFQDPYSSLNPRLRIAELISEAPKAHGIWPKNADQALEAQMRQVGLDPTYKSRFAHQFSGGQRQRIGIARALAVNPELVVCDESVASLDVSIQAQILNLFAELRTRLDLTYLFISHDLGVVQHVSDRVVIMYLGRIVEEAPTVELFAEPNHPYTRALLAEVPRVDSRRREFPAMKGELPTPLNPPSGCHFHPRCPFAMPRCAVERPALKEIAPGRKSACHLNDA